MQLILISVIILIITFATHITPGILLSQSKDDLSANTVFYYRLVEPGKPKVIECDVAIYGGTPAGVTAAIQAARMGKNTILLTFNRHVGGMTSGGLTATDIGKKHSVGGTLYRKRP